MKRFCFAALPLVLLLWAAAPAIAVRPPMMKAEEVKAGMKGYGLSVFTGTKVERFDVEVVGVLWNYFPKRHVILVRCTESKGVDYNQDGKVDDNDLFLTKGKIAAGMSGSPVYLTKDGKDYLVGAVALGWSFGTDPVAGVTPIEHMIEDMETPLEQPYSDIKAGVRRDEKEANGDPYAEYRTTLKRLAVPLTVSGFDERTFRNFNAELGKYGIRAMQGGGSAKTIADDGQKLEPGCTIGVPLVRGDVEIYAFGTLTMYDPDTGEIAAFGHTFLSCGECRMPLVMGRVTTIMTSLYDSFKFGAPTKEVGVLTRDRQSAISGRATEGENFVPMIPLTIRTAVKKTREDGKTDYQTFKLEVLDNEALLPNILQYCIGSAVGMSLPNFADATVFIQTKIKFKGYDELTTWDSYVDYGEIYNPGISMKILGGILYNPGRRISLESVEVTMDAVREFRAARIEAVRTDVKEAKPGDEVTLRVKLKGYEKGEWWEDVKVKIPEDIRGDSVDLYVQGGYDANYDAYWQMRRAFSGDSIEEMLASARDMFKPHSFVVSIHYESEGIRYKGRHLRQMPPSIIRQFDAVSGGNATVKPDAQYFVKEYDWVVGGGGSVSLKVQRKEN